MKDVGRYRISVGQILNVVYLVSYIYKLWQMRKRVFDGIFFFFREFKLCDFLDNMGVLWLWLSLHGWSCSRKIVLTITLRITRVKR